MSSASNKVSAQLYLDKIGKTAFTEIEDVYGFIGPVGRAQIFYLVALSLLNLVAAYNFLMGVFLLLTPEWACKEGMSCSTDICDMSRDNWTWINKHASMISYFELQCDPSLAYLASSLFFVPGTVAGLALSGYLSDRYGRKKTILLSIGVSLVNAIGQTAATSYPIFLVFRTLSGMSSIGYQAVHMTYRDEFFPSSKRPLCNFLGLLFKIAGLLSLAGVDYGFTTWRAINGANCVLLVISLLCVFVPESPHWLLTNVSPEAAAEVLYKMAALNLGPKHGCQGFVELAATQADRKASRESGNVADGKAARESGNVLTILRNREFLIVTLKFFYQWFVVSLLFYGFYYSLDAISGSVTVNFIIMAVLEVPTGAVTAAMMSWLGRRKTLLANLLVIMSCCALSLLKVDFGKDWTLKRIASIVGSKWGTNAVFMIVYLYTNEVMPTSIRSTGLHLCSISARLGAFIAPYVVKACNDANYYLLNGLFLVLCGGGALLTWGLPETKDKVLKTNLETTANGTTANGTECHHDIDIVMKNICADHKRETASESEI